MTVAVAPDQLPALAQIDAERARRRLRTYAEQAWGIVEPATPFIPNWHVDAICDHMQAVVLGAAKRPDGSTAPGGIKRLIINIPPRTAKSLLVSVFTPSWAWVDFPALRWLYSSYADTLSTRDSLKTRRIIESPWWQRRWGAVAPAALAACTCGRAQHPPGRGPLTHRADCQANPHGVWLTSDQNVKTRFENNCTGYRLATSVGGANTGEGGDLVICDDPHNVLEAESETIRKGVILWWDEVMTTRLNDPRTGAMVIIMQRVHEADLTGHLLQKLGEKWEHLKLPMEYEKTTYVTGLGFQDPRTVEGELLWPERFPAAQVAQLKIDLGSYGFAAQEQQRPAPREGGMFPLVWWKRYPKPLTWTELGSFDAFVMSWDMAFKDKATNSWVVGQVWGRRAASAYLLDQVRGHWDFVATLQQVIEFANKWPIVTRKLVEDKANGPAIVSALQQKVPGLIPTPPGAALAGDDKSKMARAAAVQPLVEAGNVYLPDERWCPWVAEFTLEHAQFPNGVTDDQVDTATQALLDLFFGPSGKLQVYSA